jgi:acetyl-CoA carboxylase / biotin carboxylase 1
MNPQRADPTARGSVLEAEGIVEIKFRKKELLAMMTRLDPMLACSDLGQGSSLAADVAVRQRQQQLLPVYHSAAVHFAAMHETPVRPQQAV